MKKLLVVFLSVVLVLAMAISSFAMIDGFEDEVAGEGSFGKSINDGNYQSTQQAYRNVLTASRQWSTTDSGIISTDTGLDDSNHFARLTTNQYFQEDNAITQAANGKWKVSIDIRPTSFNSFAGILFDQEAVAADGGSSTSTVDVSTYGAEYTDSQDLIAHYGYGFTLLTANHNKIRLYVNASATGTPDYVDFDLGFDCTAAFHNYAFYKDVADKKAYVYVDDKLIGYFDFEPDSGLEVDIGIYDANGVRKTDGKDGTNNNFFTEVAETTRDLICFLDAGTGIQVDIDNLCVEEYTDLPVQQNPGTGDASIVAFVAVAACVALVVLKKKETI